MFAAMARYFMKGNNPIRKIMVGTLYTYWLNHFFTLSAYAGVSLHLPCINWHISKGALDVMDLPEETDLGRNMRYMIKKILERE